MESVQKQLEALGLNEKEAKVYLASLELGPATAQQLAAKAAVVRPTAYVAIGGLVKRGLMSQFTKGKKQYFQAEKPDRLAHLLDIEKRALADREAKLKQALPMLQSLVSASGKKPEVKYYEGWDGLETMRNALLESGTKNMDVVSYQNATSTAAGKISIEKSAGFDVQKKVKKLKIRQINVGNLEFFKKWRPQVQNPNSQYRFYPTNDPNTSSEMAIFDDYVTLITYQDVPYGYLIKSGEIATLMGLMFEGMWKSPQAQDLRY